MDGICKCLALDGGGVFGIGQACVLSQVDVSKFDFFVGTSIGSVVAASLASGISRARLPEFFHEEMPRIFKRGLWRRINPFNSRYSDTALDFALIRLLKGQFGAVPKPLFVTAANLCEKRLKIFESTDPEDGSLPLWQVCRCAVAAETYFPPFIGYADGGVFANNPSMVAVAGASAKLGVAPSSLEICSIGTGSGSNATVRAGEDHSVIWWGRWLLQALLNGAADTMHEFFVNSLRCRKHLRIDFVRDGKWKMDNPSDMLRAEKAWADDIKRAVDLVSAF